MNEEMNTSGQGKDAVVPTKIQFYNFGAAVFQEFWLGTIGIGLGFSGRSFDKLRSEGISPGFAWFSGLGSRGNILAWKYKRWDSLESFLLTQKRWSRAGKAVLVLVLIVLSVFVIISFLGLLKLIATSIGN